jgi:16S rRNA (guanine527-N7)-methyltransferase
MGSPLPALDHDAFLERLSRSGGKELPRPAQEALWMHFQELRRWNPTVSLIGPGTALEVVERHYGEALAGLGLLPLDARTLLDVGSGAGFPGFVLAACEDPRLWWRATRAGV